MPSPDRYKKLLREHLEKHRPRQLRRMRAEGGLNGYLTTTAQQMAESVEIERQRLLENDPPPKGDFVKKVQHLNWAMATAESAVLNEYLPVDEETETAIGPNEAYADRTTA